MILQAAHEETGLPITAIDDENRTTTFDRHGSGKKLGACLVRKGCPKERLHIRLAGRWSGTCVPGHDRSELVCLHAASGFCSCKGSSGSNHSAQQTAAAQETRIGRAKARLVDEERYAAPAKVAAYQALLEYNPAAWNVALEIVRSGTGSSWSYEGRNHNGFFTDDHFAADTSGKEDGTPEHAPSSFEDLCRQLADWVLSVETHHHDYPDSLHRVEQFARRRMKAMGLTCEEPRYGAVDIDLVCDLATLPASDEAMEVALARAGRETLRDTERRIIDVRGEPLRGHKARLVALRARLAEAAIDRRRLKEPEPAAVHRRRLPA